MIDIEVAKASVEALYDRLWVFAERIYNKDLERGNAAHKDGWETLDERYQMQYFDKAETFYAVGRTMYGSDFAYKALP